MRRSRRRILTVICFIDPSVRFFPYFVAKQSNRLVYLDWMRGLAAVLMLQGHVMDGWVRTQDRTGESFWLSQFLGGLPAPIFLFLVGVSLAMVLDRMRARGASTAQLGKRVLRRSAWLLLLA